MKNSGFYIALSALVLSSFALTACESAKESLGMGRQVPDEFAVIKQEPLTLPPSYELRPPRPGAPRPTSKRPEMQAKEAVTGQLAKAPAEGQADNTSFSGGEDALLEKAGAGYADPDIRNKIDSITYETSKKDIPVAKRIFGLGQAESSATIVDPEKESRRIRENLKSGEPVTKGETPTLEN